MRTTLEIIIAVKECQPATEEELRLALAAMSSIDHFIEKELQTLADAVEQGSPAAKMRAGFAKKTLERMFYARKKPPADWLGAENTPGSPEHTKRLAAAKAIFKAATGEIL